MESTNVSVDVKQENTTTYLKGVLRRTGKGISTGRGRAKPKQAPPKQTKEEGLEEIKNSCTSMRGVKPSTRTSGGLGGRGKSKQVIMEHNKEANYNWMEGFLQMDPKPMTNWADDADDKDFSAKLDSNMFKQMFVNN